MINKRLRAEEIDLLKEVLSKHAPSLLPMIDSIGMIPINDELREELRGAIADELVITGLKADGEPNQRGLLLEKLIDWLGFL